MKILSVYVRHFRSVESTELLRCGGLNVLIGKNNAGKSNLLSAIEHVLNHLKRGAVSAPWVVTGHRQSNLAFNLISLV